MRVAVLTVGIAVLTAGGIGTWVWVNSDDDTVTCADISADKGIEKALGGGQLDGLDCSALAERLKDAAAGDKPGQHSMEQAQSMREIISSISRQLRERNSLTIESSLRTPLAQLLADYTFDTHEILRGLDADYVLHLSDEKPWKDLSGQVRMTVADDELVPLMRAVSEEPSAYAEMRSAEGRHAAQKLSDIHKDGKTPSLRNSSLGNSLALGSYDGIASHVTSSLEQADAENWRKRVRNAMASSSETEVPEYKANPVGHIVSNWKKELGDTNQELSNLFRNQSLTMLRSWAEAQGPGFKLPAGLESDSLNDVSRTNGETTALLKKFEEDEG
ncbi:hypothetical protein [Streptomyces sp. NPDC002851]